MEDYTGPLAVTILLIGFNFYIVHSCYKTNIDNENVSDEVERKTIAIYIFSQGLIGISLGSIILFKVVPIFGTLLNALFDGTDFANAINEEESFLINFCVFFGLLGIYIYNGVYSQYFKNFIDFSRNNGIKK